MAHTGGPFIHAACFVENVIRDDTGTFSLIRMIDRITRAAASPNPPENMEPFDYPLRIFIGLKSGEARGHSEIRIVPELPNGQSLDPFIVKAHFEGEEHGFAAVFNIVMNFPYEGLYWFKVFVDDNLMTSMPLRIVYDRQFLKQQPTS
ncbi:MAG: hypothetical protein ABFD53_06075 [Anaerolineaceae bacterium]